MFCNKQSASVNKNDDEMRELLGIHDVSIGHFIKYCYGLRTAHTHKNVSIGFYPGAA